MSRSLMMGHSTAMKNMSPQPRKRTTTPTTSTEWATEFPLSEHNGTSSFVKPGGCWAAGRGAQSAFPPSTASHHRPTPAGPPATQQTLGLRALVTPGSLLSAATGAMAARRGGAQVQLLQPAASQPIPPWRPPCHIPPWRPLCLISHTLYDVMFGGPALSCHFCPVLQTLYPKTHPCPALCGTLPDASGCPSFLPNPTPCPSPTPLT